MRTGRQSEHPDLDKASVTAQCGGCGAAIIALLNNTITMELLLVNSDGGVSSEMLLI